MKNLAILAIIGAVAFAQFAGAQQVPNIGAPMVPNSESSSGSSSFGSSIDVALVNPPILCNGTDQTSNLNTLLTALQTAGTGGALGFHACTYTFSSAIVLPNNSASTPTQATFVFQGAGGYVSGNGAAGIGGTIFDIRTSSAQGHIQTYGLGSLSIRDIQITDGGTSAGNPFLYTTNTTLYVDHSAFIGSPAITGATANQDAIVLGGTTGTVGGGTNAPFQGYGTVINANYFNAIRRVAYCRVFCNGIVVQNNFVWTTSGNPLQGALSVTSVANGGSGYVVGEKITLAGGTSSPPAVLTVLTLSGNAVATVSIRQQGSYTATPSNPVAQASSSGVGTGATFNMTWGVTGAAIEIDGSGAGGVPANYAVGNNILNNTIEAPNYAYFVNILFGEFTSITGNNIFDTTATTIAGVYADGDALSTYVIGALNDSLPWVSGASPSSTLVSLNGATPSTMPNGVGPLTVNGQMIVTGTNNQFGTAGSSNQLSVLQTSGIATFNADGTNLVIRNAGTGSLFFDSASSGGIINFRSTSSFTNVLNYSNTITGAWVTPQPFFAQSIGSKGSVPTGNTGTCSTGVTVAGASTVGTWTSTAICALAGTIILSAMPTAPTGYVCDMVDRTTAGVTVEETATGTTSATFTVRALPTGSVATVANDILQYKCMAY